MNKESNPNLLWDTIKMAIRGESIKFGATQKKEIDKEIVRLEKEIQRLNELSSNTPLSDTDEGYLQSAKTSLCIIINQKAQGAYVRSRAENYEEGEKNKSSFFNIEKRNSTKKSVNKLRISKTEVISDQNRILDHMKTFYKTLYSQKKLENSNTFLRNLSPPKTVNEEQSIIMTKDLTLDEIAAAIKEMKSNKSPGEDGLPIEFYRIFWEDIKIYLFESYKFSLQEKSLSITQKRGVISLLPKKGDLLMLKNWRPLTLLNVDYKILAKLIATRMKKVLLYIINEDQTGFLPKRFIGQNIVSMFEIMNFCDENELAAVLISIDFEKAFDQIDWDFIWDSMIFFKFPPKIINWIKTIYKGAQSSVINNGHMSEYFSLGRGVRQGCPLSPYLFIIAAEILAISLRSNELIKGIKIGEKESKIKQFADDSQALSIFDKESINATFKNFEDYGKVSGSVINFDKSKLMRIGSIKDSLFAVDLDYKDVKWTNGPIEILGINFYSTLEETTKYNYEKVLEKIDKAIQIWSTQKLTLFGKISVINTVLLSKLISKLSSLPSPSTDMIKRIENKFIDFLWSSKRHAISKEMLTKNRSNFGLNFPCIATKDKSLKMAWIKRLLNSDADCVSPFLKVNLKVGFDTLFRCNLKKSDLKDCSNSQLPLFWKQTLEIWCEANYRSIDQIENPNEEILWLNSNIKLDHKTIFIKEMFDNNIVRVKDLQKDDQTWLNFVYEI